MLYVLKYCHYVGYTHCCWLMIWYLAGVGEPLTVVQTRMLLALRINVLAKGFSGIRECTLRSLLQALNMNALSKVPCKGSVGASGDLAPLAHLALGMLGEGLMFDPATVSNDHPSFLPAKDVLASIGMKPVTLSAKEGLALINGTQLIASIGVEALFRARRSALAADCIAAMTVECLKGSARPFHPLIHATRPHKGQQQVAGRLRALLAFDEPPSTITFSHIGCSKVQDSYTLRCIPQVHGIVHDTTRFVSEIITTELNSSTDNPQVFAGVDAHSVNAHQSINPHTGLPINISDSSQSQLTRGIVLSGGNFHGEYPAKVMDYLAIAIAEVGSISERRTERLVNPHLSGLPAFLTRQAGLGSGYMMAHVTAAALVSENKVLCHPASSDSISTSAAQEDHVSNGPHAARKALQIVEHIEQILAIELLCCCQALDLLRPLKSTKPIEAIYDVVRKVVPEWNEDRFMSPDIEAVAQLIREGKIYAAVDQFIPDGFKHVSS